MCLLSIAQAQYTSIPSVGSLSNCTTINGLCLNNGNSTYLPNEVRWKLDQFIGNTARFQVKKCNYDFNSSGRMFIKESDYCGTVVGFADYGAGTSFQFIDVPLTHFGSKTYCAVVIPNYDPNNPNGSYDRY